MFAFLEFNGERFVQFGNYLLMVAGAFLVGYLVGWVLIAQADRWIFRRRLPQPFYQVVRLLVGIICAVLVAVALFGFGFGPGNGGNGIGDGTTEYTGEAPQGKKNSNTTQPSPKNNDPTIVPAPVNIEEIAPNRVEITLLGGTDVKNGKFYLIGDDPKPKSFVEVKDSIVEKAAKSAETFAVVIRFRSENRLASDHFAVNQLRDWAGPKGKGYTIIMPS